MKKHPYTRTTIQHHDDNSHSIHHEHKDGKSHKDYARGDHDSMLDGILDNTSDMNPGEGNDEANKALVTSPAAGGAAASPPASPAAAALAAQVRRA